MNLEGASTDFIDKGIVVTAHLQSTANGAV